MRRKLLARLFEFTPFRHTSGIFSQLPEKIIALPSNPKCSFVHKSDLFGAANMTKLTPEQLPVFLSAVENDFPAALNVYFLARNIIRKEFAWPGLEFFVDNFPDISACICRTAKLKQQNISPFFNGYSIFTYAKHPTALAKLLSVPGIIDWSETISFCMVKDPEDVDVIKQKCAEMDGTADIPSGQNLYDHGLFVHFDLGKMFPDPETITENTDAKSSTNLVSLPEKFHLGQLQVQHAEQVTREKYYGDSETNIRFFRHVFAHDFPSSALFNEENELIAYVLQRPENVIGVGFVVEKYRSRGYFKIVLQDLLRKMRANGETMAYADVTPDNVSSLNAMFRLGGTLFEGLFEWFQYRPKSVKSDCLYRSIWDIERA